MNSDHIERWQDCLVARMNENLELQNKKLRR